MNTKWLKIGVAILVLGIIGFAALAVNAQETPPFGWANCPFGNDNSLISVTAETLGLTTDELLAELESGKTIAELAEARGVSLDTIVESFAANHREHLTAMVEAGRLTQEQADTMQTTMNEHLTARLSEPFTANAYGMGNGPMMGHGHGMGMMGRGHGMGMMGRGMSGGMRGTNMMGYGGMGIMGEGMGFVDTDGDGVCDHFQPTQPQGN